MVLVDDLRNLKSVPAGDMPRKNLARDLFFRFTLLYFFLSDWVWMDELIVNPTRLVHPIFNAIFGGLGRWLGHHLFHLSGPLEPNSFRDTRYLYLLLLAVAIVSVILAVAWTVLDRAGRSVHPSYAFLRVWIRYTLAYMILIYAMDKIFRLQFPFPTLQRLIEPYGESSPMALLWTYVGYSPVLTIFSGAAEATGAVLLLFRRTAPLGALISVVMMANVALMDFCYDVSVKMLAAHFLAMGVFLLAHDGRRLLNVLAFNAPAPARDLAGDDLPISSPRFRRFVPVLRTLIILYTIVPIVPRTYKIFRQVGPFAPHVPLFGLYRVKSVEINGVARPLVVNDGRVWQYVIIEKPAEATFKAMDGTLTTARAKYDSASSGLDITGGAASVPLHLAITKESLSGLRIVGTQGPDRITEHLERVDPQSFVLVSRGFHWINETSFSK